MNMRSFLPLSFARVLLLGAVLGLAACGGGGGGGASGGASGGSGVWGAGDLLPDVRRFMPEHYTQAELEIEHSRFLLRFTCLRGAPTGECVTGELADTGGLVEAKNAGSGAEALRGSWEQRADNSLNCIQGLYVYRAGAQSMEDFMECLNITILRREDEPAVIDDTVILSGTVESGTLLFGDEEHALAGARVRLVYTIDAAHVNAQTHGAPAAE